jgi:ankyrin repeat protein
MTRALRYQLLGAALGAMLATAALSAAPATPLADAAERGDTGTVKALLAQAADVNAPQGDGMTALHWAAFRNDTAVAAMLLHAGANPKAATRVGGYTPLLLAAKQGNAAVMAPLLSAGADVNATTSNGTTPLMFAAASGEAAAVEALIAQHADVNARESTRGLTAAMFAAAANRAAVIAVLARHGADLAAASRPIDLRNLDRSVFAGVLFGNPEPPKTPGGQAGSVEQGGRRMAPAAGGSARVAGVDRDFQGNELVHTQGGMTPLLLAARQGHLDTARALLDAGVDVNQTKVGDGISPLMIATINGHFDLAKVLLDQGADPNLSSGNGATPLYSALNLEWAPRAGRPQPRAHLNQTLSYLDLMRVLLDRGADPNARLATRVWYSGGLSGVDEMGATPFWRAAYASDIDAMRLLVSRGADPMIATVKGVGRPPTDDGQREFTDVSPLPPIPKGGPGVPPLVAAGGVGYGEGFAGNTHHYAPSGMLAAVKYLVEELHADVNAMDHEGNTALHNAAARGDVEMIRYLVAKGADVRAVNREGKTTADMANGPVQRIQPFPEALALLEKLGATNNHRCVSC